jgi:Ca2+-transporting ATPase
MESKSLNSSKPFGYHNCIATTNTTGEKTMGYYAGMSIDEVFNTLNTSISGLSSEEVQRRQLEKGYNRLQARPPIPAWKILIGQFANFIIYLLLFAVVFSILIGEYGDSLVILAILLLNGMIGFFQELSANRSLEALKKMVTVAASVTRNGITTKINAEQLVYGDIINLENGDKIPADARIINSIELQVEESALTGESEPARKQVRPLDDNLGPADQTNMVFAATAVVSGRGMAIVTACGMETEIGRISKMVAEAEEEKTPLQRRLDLFGRNLGLVIILICLLVFSLSLGRLWLNDELINRIVFLEFAFIAISLAVAAVPTALPAVVTIALSIGTRRLLAKNMLVRRLTSVETLGSCDVICSDKTGTITKNIMTVRRVWTLAGEIDFKHDDIHAKTTQYPPFALLFRIGTACNNSGGNHLSGSGGNPTELALLTSASKAGIEFHGKRKKERPFDSERKCMSVVIEEDSHLILYTKGAPDHLINHCSKVLINSEVLPLTEKYEKIIVDAYRHFGSQAMRVMAFAYRNLDSAEDTEERNLIFVGLQAMIDPPRENVIDSIRRAKQAHIRVIMITGDHHETAAAIAREIGITGNAMTGRQIDSLNDTELAEALTCTNIFARVIPEHKQRIVKALQDNGHTVAMTGDGVNDAPALKKADIGIAVGSGTDVAREASDFVLLDDSFTSIVEGVEEGRGIYENIQKSIMLLLSGNLMEVLIIFVSVLLGFNLPLTALLLLWINLVTDGAPALAYSVDPYGIRIMHRPPIPMSEGILPRYRLRLLITLGVAGTLIGLILFQISGGHSSETVILQRAQTMVFNYIVLYEMLLVFVIRRSYQVRLFTNGWLWISVIFSLLMQAMIMYTPANTLFHVTPLSLTDLGELLTATGLFALVCMLFKPAADRDLIPS